LLLPEPAAPDATIGGPAAAMVATGTSARPASAWLTAAALICLLCAAGSAGGDLLLARGQLAVPQRALRTGRDYVAGAYTLEEFPGVGPFRWTGATARFIWKPETRLLSVTVWAQHPDIAQLPVHVTLATPCQVLLDQDLTSTAAVRIGLELPDEARMVDATVRVSRTWQPAAYGAADTRRLGVGVAGQFLDDRSQLNDQALIAKIQKCP